MTILDVSAIISAVSLVAIAAGPWLRGKADAPVIQVTASEPVIQVNVPPPHVVVEVVPAYAPVSMAPAANYSSTVDHGEVQILKVTGDGHSHIGYRHPAHPDVQEALNSPHLAVRWPDGRIESQVTAGDGNG